VLQSVAVCCSRSGCSSKSYVAVTVGCSGLQWVAVGCSVLKGVAPE